MSTARRLSIRARSFPDQIRARAIRAEGSTLGAFIADELDRLAEVAAYLNATSPAELVDRREAEESALREHWYELGRDLGRKEGDPCNITW